MKKFVLCLLLASPGALAQVNLPDSPDPPAPALTPAVTLTIPPRVGIVGEVPLTLQEVIAAVLSNNRDISIANVNYQRAILTVRAARGYFDPVVGGRAYALRQVSPEASSLGGALNGAVTQTEIYADPQISGNSPWLGTTYKLDFESSRVDNNNTFNTLNPTYPSAATLNLVQPLWGGLRFDLNRERLLLAKKGVGQSKDQFRQRVMEVTTQAIHAYAELDFARKNLEVQIAAVGLAEKQDAFYRHQVALGLQAPIDLVQTQMQISTYQQNVFIAQQQVTETENTLKRLMLPDRNDALWNMGIQTSSGSPESGPVPALDDAMRQALADRPDLKAGQVGVQVSGVEARLAKEQARPQVNLTAKLSAQGLAGRAVADSTDIFGTLFTPLFNRVNDLSAAAGLPPLDTSALASTNSVPDFFIGGYGQSLTTLREFRFPTVQVGIQVSLPIGNRTASAEAAVAEASRRQTLTEQQQLEMAITSEVRNTLQRLVDTVAVLEAAHRTAQLAQQQLEGEQRQFNAGMSSVYLVLQRQIELTNAKLREIRATEDRGEAQADLDRATGNTLRRQKIDIGAEEKRKP